jgi:hypothetical protein
MRGASERANESETEKKKEKSLEWDWWWTVQWRGRWKVYIVMAEFIEMVVFSLSIAVSFIYFKYTIVIVIISSAASWIFYFTYCATAKNLIKMVFIFLQN